MSEDKLDSSSCIGDNEGDTEHTSEVSQVITLESQSFVKPSTSASCKPKLLGKRPSLRKLPPKRIMMTVYILPCTKQIPNRFENSINKLQKIAEMATVDTI